MMVSHKGISEERHSDRLRPFYASQLYMRSALLVAIIATLNHSHMEGIFSFSLFIYLPN